MEESVLPAHEKYYVNYIFFDLAQIWKNTKEKLNLCAKKTSTGHKTVLTLNTGEYSFDAIFVNSKGLNVTFCFGGASDFCYNNII